MSPRDRVMVDMLHNAAEAERWATDHLAALIRQTRAAGLSIKDAATATGLPESELWLITGDLG